MDWHKTAPWNWFRKEQDRDAGSLPVMSTTDPLAGLRQEMDRVFDDAFRRFGTGSARSWPWPSQSALEGVQGLLRPSLDISEGRKSYTVRVEIPGVEKDDVTIRVEDDAIFIRGEKRQEKEESEEDYHCVERSYGAFERVLALPEDADAEGVHAKFGNGVLKLTISKRPVSEKESRTIEIHHA